MAKRFFSGHKQNRINEDTGDIHLSRKLSNEAILSDLSQNVQSYLCYFCEHYFQLRSRSYTFADICIDSPDALTF